MLHSPYNSKHHLNSGVEFDIQSGVEWQQNSTKILILALWLPELNEVVY